MPQESRILSFSKNELFDALQNYCTQTGAQLSRDSGKRLALKPSGEVEIEQPGHNLHFTPSEVAAALILFCAKMSIPVPRRSAKVLEVQGEILNLRLTMS